MLKAINLDLFHIPVGYPRPADNSKPTREHVENWLNSDEGKNAGAVKRTSYGTYAGLFAAAVGAISSFLGLAKDSKICKFIGGFLALIGLGVAAAGKLFGYDFNLIEKVIDKDIHGLADACGRVSKLFSLFLAIRNDAPVKVYPGRDVCSYQAMGPRCIDEKMLKLESAKGLIDIYQNQPDFVAQTL